MFKEIVVKVVNVFVVKKYMYEVHMYVCTYVHVLRTLYRDAGWEIGKTYMYVCTSSYHSYFVLRTF